MSALALVAGACSGSTSKSASAVLTDAAVPHAAKKITHVFVINLENEDFQTSWGPTSPAKYLNGTLRKKGQLLTKYYAIGHVSLDNYIAQISGQSPNLSTQTDCTTYTPFVSTGTSAVTLTVSLVTPMASWRSTVNVAPTGSVMSLRTVVLKPLASTVRS